VHTVSVFIVEKHYRMLVGSNWSWYFAH